MCIHECHIIWTLSKALSGHDLVLVFNSEKDFVVFCIYFYLKSTLLKSKKICFQNDPRKLYSILDFLFRCLSKKNVSGGGVTRNNFVIERHMKYYKTKSSARLAQLNPEYTE